MLNFLLEIRRIPSILGEVSALLPAGFINFNLKGHVNFSNTKKTSSNIVWSQIQFLSLHNTTGGVLEYISQDTIIQDTIIQDTVMLVPKYSVNTFSRRSNTMIVVSLLEAPKTCF